MMRIAIVIPVYRMPTLQEEVALRQCCKNARTHRLPMGYHGWYKYEYEEFWRDLFV